jgi:hypothetical protein
MVSISSERYTPRILQRGHREGYMRSSGHSTALVGLLCGFILAGLISGCKMTTPTGIYSPKEATVEPTAETRSTPSTKVITDGHHGPTPSMPADPFPSPDQISPGPVLPSENNQSQTEISQPNHQIIDADPFRYVLVPPTPSTLLSLLSDTRYQTSDEWEELEFDLSFSGELPHFVHTIDYEIKRHYPAGLPDPQEIFKIAPWEFPSPPWYFHSMTFQDLVMDGVIDFLHKEQLVLQDGEIITGPRFEAKVYLVEMDGDPGREWFLHIQLNDYRHIVWLAIDERDGPSYKRLQSGLQPFRWYLGMDSYHQLKALRDFTGDGLTDLIIVEEHYVRYSAAFIFYIAKGTPNGFEMLSTIKDSVSMEFGSSLDYEITGVQDPKDPILVLTRNNDLRWDCEWNTVTAYSWPGGVEHSLTQGLEPPSTAECKLAKAVSFEDLSIDETIELLEDALHGFDLNTPEQCDKAQYARYRLALLYAIKDFDESARIHLNTFLRTYTQGAYAGSERAQYLEETLTPILEAPTINPLQLCKLVHDQPERFGAWVSHVEPYVPLVPSSVIADALCSQYDVLQLLLDQTIPAPSNSLIDSLTTTDLPIITSLEFPLKTGKTAWFVLLNTEPITLYGYVPWEGEFAWQYLHAFDGTIENLMWTDADITGDGLPEIAIVAASANDGDACDVDQCAYDMHVTTSIGGGTALSVPETPCWPKLEEFDLYQALRDDDGDGLVDRIMDRVTTNYDLNQLYKHEPPILWLTYSQLWDFAEFIEEPMLDERDINEILHDHEDLSQARTDLNDMRSQLPQEGPLTPFREQRYNYLIALTYELEGRDFEAIQMYLEVALSQPHSPWGDLAASHLFWLGNLAR